MSETYMTIDTEIKPELESFRRYIFNLVDTDNLSRFSQKIFAMHDQNDRFVGQLQDEIMSSPKFQDVCNHKYWTLLSSRLLNTDLNDVNIVFPHFRIDLPSRYKKDELKMSLPWHQEAGYYLKKGHCSPESIVLSTYLHDCTADHGALHVGIDHDRVLQSHDENFMDKKNQRHLRVTCREPTRYEVVESNFGQTVTFDFLRPHRSGKNTSKLVRLTLLLRASSQMSVQSWLKKSIKRQ